MDTKQYIVNDVKPVSFTTPISEVQQIFNQLTYTHLPVLNGGKFVGCISESDVHCFQSDKTLEDYLYAVEPFFVKENTNWLDILEAFALHDSNVMPVLGKNNTYLGYFELNDIISMFNNTPFLNEAGAIIVVEKNSMEYSFSEVCQIIESNEAKLLGVFISKIVGDTTQLTIKIGHSGMNAIVQTFRRYGYIIVSQHDEDKLIKDLKERSDYLDKYLNI